MTAALLALMPILGLSQHGGMGGGGGGGMPSGGSMSRPTGGSGMSSGMGTRMEQSGGMSGFREERRMHAEALQHGHRDLLDFDPHGNLIVRNEIVGFGATTRGLAAVQAAGFVISRQSELKGLDAVVVVLTAPQGMSTRKALKKLRELDPDAVYDFNHVYFKSGTDAAAANAAASVPTSPSAGDGQKTLARRVGLIDGGVEPGHAALRSLSLHMHGCNGTAVPSAHGTAIASRLVAGFNEAAPTLTDVNLYVADVYCGAPTGGSTDALIQALAWLIQENVPVINVSLVGPPNVLLQRVVELASALGHLIVAAVGNDGPSAPPLYPAASTAQTKSSSRPAAAGSSRSRHRVRTSKPPVCRAAIRRCVARPSRHRSSPADSPCCSSTQTLLPRGGPSANSRPLQSIWAGPGAIPCTATVVSAVLLEMPRPELRGHTDTAGIIAAGRRT
jgi:hypothetical protein